MSNSLSKMYAVNKLQCQMEYCLLIASWMSSKLEPVIWLRVLVTLAYMKGWTDIRTDVHDVMAIKPKFLTSMGYHIFLTIRLTWNRILKNHRRGNFRVIELSFKLSFIRLKKGKNANFIPYPI